MLDILWYFFIFIFVILSICLLDRIGVNNFKLINIKTISINSLLYSLGTKIGVGSFVGTAMCIIIGGYGSIFWLCFFTIIFSSLTYAETYMGYIYKNNIIGPYGFINKAFNNTFIAVTGVILLIFTYTYLFMSIQIKTLYNLFNISVFVFILITLYIFIILLFLINKKIRKVLNITTIFMCLLIIFSSLYIIISNISFVPYIIKLIFLDAFSKKGLTIGTLIAIKKAFFLNEYLIGTTSISTSLSNKSLKETCITQVISSYFISFVIVILIAFVLILYNEKSGLTSQNYIAFVRRAYIYFIGRNGTLIFNAIIILLCLSTIISGIYICLGTISSLNNQLLNIFFKISMLLFCIVSLFIDDSIIWFLTDLFILILAILNGLSLFKLRNVIEV